MQSPIYLCTAYKLDAKVKQQVETKRVLFKSDRAHVKFTMQHENAIRSCWRN